MARKRTTPKPAADLPASISFPDEVSEDMLEMLDVGAALIKAFRMRRLVLLRSQVIADSDGLTEDGLNTLSMDVPESYYEFDPKSHRLRVTCYCRLTASRGVATGRKKKKDSTPLLTVEAAFLLEYDVVPDVIHAVTDAVFDVFSDVAIAQAWPYWREFVRDASTRTGLPVIDVPFEVEF